MPKTKILATIGKRRRTLLDLHQLEQATPSFDCFMNRPNQQWSIPPLTEFTERDLLRYSGLFRGQQLIEWLTQLPNRVDAEGNRYLYDHPGEVRKWCGDALRYASQVAADTARFPEYSQHMRSGCGIPSSRALVDSLVREGLSGWIVGCNGQKRALSGNAQHKIVSATVYTGPNLKWSNNYAASIAPIVLPNGDAALPLVGGFLWRGEDLTALEHSKFPITAEHETDGQKATIPVYFQGGRSILIPVDTFIHYKPLPSGGLELPAEAVANEDGYIKKRIVAFQYVGAGHSTYIRHFFKPAGRLADGQAYFSINGSETRSITDPRYWAKDGIFLDQRYQEATSAPTGAMVNCGEVVEMEKALLANGALIGAVTVGFVPLISKAELDAIVCGESGAPFEGTIDVQVKAIVDSTNRLDMLLCYGKEGKIKGFNSVPEDLVRALFARQLGSIAKTYFGEKEDSLERYLSRLGEVMGTNFRAAILSGLTIPWDGKPAENLSLTGMLCDVENCEACDAPYNFASMALQWIEILV